MPKRSRAEHEGDALRRWRASVGEELARRARRRAEVARRHRRGADVGDAVQRLGQRRDDARAGQHVGRAAGHRDRPPRAAARRRQRGATSTRSREAHHLHRARRRADVAGVAGVHQDEAGRVAGHARSVPAKMVSIILQRAVRMRRGRSLPPVTPASTPARSHVASAAPHAQHRHQGRPRRRGDHQPRLARRRPCCRSAPRAPNDFVTEVDHAAEAGDHRDAAHRLPRPRHPGRGIGHARTARKDSDYVWIIDPLDGTTNFIHGFPVYAVSIALAFRGQVAAGRRLRPDAQRPVLRHQGPRRLPATTGACACRKRTRLHDALIGTGFPFRKGDNFKHYLQMFEPVMQRCAGLRRPGAAALDLCYVAAGCYDGFFETGLNPWDVAAGSLMVTEAGGLIGNFTGEADFLYQREVRGRQPEDLRPAGAAAGAVHACAIEGATSRLMPSRRRRRGATPVDAEAHRRGQAALTTGASNAARRSDTAPSRPDAAPGRFAASAGMPIDAQGPADAGRVQRPHADDAAVPAHQGRASPTRWSSTGWATSTSCSTTTRASAQPPARHHADHARRRSAASRS